ncbi:MAG: hypothetical protein J6P98_06300 [Clostridia bacterium]|nr:hypothetical protein [Clostridia bacterium]
MKPSGFFGKLFLGQYYFTIALRRRRPQGIAGGLPFRAEAVIPSTKVDWAADPMLIDDGERTWLFYEAVHGQKGRIEVAEVTDDCKLSEPTVLLEDECHYSYPFVFKAKGEWYMIPESSAANEVRLYRAESFPFRWELQRILLKARAVDTTVLEKDGMYWLLTFLLDNGTERVFPKAYVLTDWSEPDLKEVPWQEFDPLRVRGAGPVFREGKDMLRPAQISTESRYGDGLAFYHAEPSEHYREELSFEVLEKDIKAGVCFVDGLHTYTASGRYEAIDIRCRAFEPFKLIKRMIPKRGKTNGY